MSIKNKVALITSLGGIGTAAVLKFAQEGANLVICDLSEDRVKEIEAELAQYGTKVVGVACDMGKIDDIDRLFDVIDQEFGTLDILVNGVGIAGPTKSILDLSVEEWDATLDINLRSYFYCIKKAAPYMIEKGKGKIVCLSSQSGKRALNARSPYCASKMAIIGLARVAALELGKYDITVNTVCPGPVEGKRLYQVWENMARQQGISFEEMKERWLQPAMLKRPVPPNDIAEMILFLSDEERSNSITGQDINVNVGIITY